MLISDSSAIIAEIYLLFGGRMYLITGGGSGIGRALAHSLAERGQDVLIIGRRQSALAETASLSSHISFFSADLTTEAGCRLVAEQVQNMSALKGLIHNAGVVDPIQPLAALELTAWQQALSTNLTAPMFLSQLLLPKLQGGRVLHIGSGMAYFPAVGCAAYCVSKAALSMLTRCWQLESSDPVFASVMPGIIDTEMQSLIRHSQHMNQDKVDFFKRLKREERLVSTETVACFLTWLLLDVDRQRYSSKEWDIYNKDDQSPWLIPPHTVPAWE